MVLMNEVMEVVLLIDGSWRKSMCVDEEERRKKWEGRLFVLSGASE